MTEETSISSVATNVAVKDLEAKKRKEKSLNPDLAPWYLWPLNFFLGDKEPENFFTYKSMDIHGFRGLSNVSINFSKNDLILLLGLNESGKTSILKAIECFDFNNDPVSNLKNFFTSIRNKQDIDCNTPCIITAKIEFSSDLPNTFFKKVLKESCFDPAVKTEVEQFIETINQNKVVEISRVIPFSGGNPGRSYYKFNGAKILSDNSLEAVLAQEIVRRCPYIMYFEDFQDAIPTKIYTDKQNVAYNPIWYEIIDGLFFNTDKNFSIKKYLGYFAKNNRREDDARTVLKKVNKTLQETFTKKWQELSGVKEIEHVEIEYKEDKQKSCFQIKISEKDGTTYSVHERSKGAVWYLAFLMKTEFRRKKLREGSGKPIYLIDEPASNLHSTAQNKMVDDFFKLVEDTTVIYTTHSQYLVSPSNVKNTYVVQRNDGTVSCTKWGDYIKGKDSKISYYQPLYDCLNIVPNNFDIPWFNAVITEGPSDALVLELMQILLKDKRTHVIYPGTSASDLSELISLNEGWRVNYKVLLDSDSEGLKQKERYIMEHGLLEETIVLLPKDKYEIESMFTNEELCSLYELIIGVKITEISKKQFLELMRSCLAVVSNKKSAISKIISNETKELFADLLTKLGIIKEEATIKAVSKS